VIELRGELDIATCPRLRRELRETHTDDSQKIVLDLAGLNFIDSSGVRLLLEVTGSTGYGDRSRVLLTRGQENIRRVLRAAGIEDHLPFVD
jgi:anti-sigma B factor antagonist